MQQCHGCDLYCRATQAVFGDGPVDAEIVFIGEQPGDQEDRAGKPFVGPSGHLLDEIMDQAGIDRGNAYVTNAVKHFRFQLRGKRRIHVKPSARQINACQPWLEAEIQLIKPKITVCLGATAAQSLLGRSFRVTQHRGELIHDSHWGAVMASVHPSSVLRATDAKTRKQDKIAFLQDMRSIARQLARLPA